jgi:hypothetical protein
MVMVMVMAGGGGGVDVVVKVDSGGAPFKASASSAYSACAVLKL